MKTNRYVTQSAVVLGLFALLTVPQVVGQADEATAPVSTTSTETVVDSGASVVSGQGTSGTAVQGGTETVSYTHLDVYKRQVKDTCLVPYLTKNLVKKLFTTML